MVVGGRKARIGLHRSLERRGRVLGTPGGCQCPRQGVVGPRLVRQRTDEGCEDLHCFFVAADLMQSPPV